MALTIRYYMDDEEIGQEVGGCVNLSFDGDKREIEWVDDVHFVKNVDAEVPPHVVTAYLIDATSMLNFGALDGVIDEALRLQAQG